MPAAKSATANFVTRLPRPNSKTPGPKIDNRFDD
jgi:hypothetical protein